MVASLRRFARILLAVAWVAWLVSGCGFPESDYGFVDGNTKKDAATETGPDVHTPDVLEEDASEPPPDVRPDESSEDSPLQDTGKDVLSESDATQEVGPDVPDVLQDTKPDGVPEVGPDVPADVPKDVPADKPADVLVDVPADVPVDVPPDVPPEAPLPPLLNVWHIPTNQEPPTAYMRNPVIPLAGGDVFIYFGIAPLGRATGANLYWWWSGESTPTVVPFAWDSNNAGNEYWLAKFKMPARPIGTFRYYIEVIAKFPAEETTAWLYGTDSATNKTHSNAIASASPYKPEVRLPHASGDGGLAEIVITEAMINAKDGVSEWQKEWFEVYSAAPVPVTLNGCKIGDSGQMNSIADPELILWPGVYAVFGYSANNALMEGFLPDYAYGNPSGIQFANTSDTIRVALPDDTLIDQVAYGTSIGWPAAVYNTDAHSAQYKTLTPNAVDNDSASNWCRSLKVYGLGTSYGTPQAPSDLCAP